MENEDTLAKARRRNDILHQLLRALMDSNRVNHAREPEKRLFEKNGALDKAPRIPPPEDDPSTGPLTFFEELRNNIQEIKNQKYVPPRKSTEDQAPKANGNGKLNGAKDEEVWELAGPETDSKFVHRDMLVLKLERQGITIETLESEVRKLRLQNQQLREANHGLREAVCRKKTEGVEFRNDKPFAKTPKPEKPRSVGWSKVAPVPSSKHPETHLARQKPEPMVHQNAVYESQARAEEAESRFLQQQLLADQLRAGLTQVHARYKEAKRRLAASLEISAFQERVILGLREKEKRRDRKRQKERRQRNLSLESTADLIRGRTGCESDSDSESESESESESDTQTTENGFSTTQLIQGPLRPLDPYGHLNKQEKPSFRAAALAVLFAVRLARTRDSRI